MVFCVVVRIILVELADSGGHVEEARVEEHKYHEACRRGPKDNCHELLCPSGQRDAVSGRFPR